MASKDVLGQLLRVLGANKLFVVRCAYVDEGADGGGAVGRLKGRVMDRVAVDLAYVEVVLDLGYSFRLDAVGDTPYLLRCGLVVIC